MLVVALSMHSLQAICGKCCVCCADLGTAIYLFCKNMACRQRSGTLMEEFNLV
jgi:hypothetical protein